MRLEELTKKPEAPIAPISGACDRYISREDLDVSLNERSDDEDDRMP